LLPPARFAAQQAAAGTSTPAAAAAAAAPLLRASRAEGAGEAAAPRGGDAADALLACIELSGERDRQVRARLVRGRPGCAAR
jgi:hypothetical protein